MPDDRRMATTAIARWRAGLARYRNWRERRKHAPRIELRFERNEFLGSVETDRYVLRVMNHGDATIPFSRDLILNVDLKDHVRRLMPATVTSVPFPFELAPRCAFQFEIEVDEMARVFKNVPDSGVFDVCCLIFDTFGRKYMSPCAAVSTYEMAARRDTIEDLLSASPL